MHTVIPFFFFLKVFVSVVGGVDCLMMNLYGEMSIEFDLNWVLEFGSAHAAFGGAYEAPKVEAEEGFKGRLSG